ncbi:hypothetical protein C1I95_25665 [Micromonospora craterilacus]|uniref:Uncharacterized protein n=1 Tax=Micromonospora craterilacus TaxID=1655439 RepID=A0A2W2DPB9_9ACTN|nr:hypothetical protein [Micromonospora craterilacus]PZG12493.1 hypothetical protein C1I95_25665 [Micromonospora craterilacus]
MSEHSMPQPAHQGGIPHIPSIDLVAGDPPVPISVWRTARTDGDAGLGVGARLAYRLVSAYSQPGEVVVDLTAGHRLADACAAGGRRHHPAWFTDAASMIIGGATPPAEPDPNEGGDDEDDLPDLDTWFGDDLTDPDLPPSGEPVADLPPGSPLEAATSLVVATWPLDDSDATNRVRLAWLLTACAGLLRPGGCLILVVTAPTGATPEDFTPVVQAAAGVGLGYLQHIVAVTADTDGDTFVYHITDEELLTLAQQNSDQPWAVAHLRVHADVLVFSQRQAPAQAGRRTGGRRG